jgi:hypothetical protein
MLELAVVLAIILILMAIMLPVFIQAKNAAVGGVCSSNLRSIYKSMLMYSEDHGGHGLTYGKAVYPPSMGALRLPASFVRTTHCGGNYIPAYLWHSWPEHAAKHPSNAILVVDLNTHPHNGRVLGLYNNGKIARRQPGDRDAGDPSFW